MSSILIKKGRVIDPAEGVDRVADVLLLDGRVEEILDEINREADLEIDGTGKVVCPGFIDIHMHEDPYDPRTDTLDRSIARSMVQMGVTTALGGNCGDNQWDPGDYLDMLDRKGTAMNLGLLAGHTYLRNAGGGADKYAAVSAETLERMKELGRACLERGCFGVSFGVKYVPGSTAEELAEIAGLCRPVGGLVASHVRRDVDGVFEAVQEMAELGKRLELPVQISHIGSMGGYGQMEELLGQIDGYRAQGVDVMCDSYPYDAFSTSIGETTYDEGFLESYRSDYGSILICDGKYGGKRCTKEIFKELRRDAPETMTVGYFMKAADVEMAILNPCIMIGSDGVRNGDQGHPRAAGAFPRVFDQYVKTGKLSLTEAIRKMTEMPARRLSLTKKGRLAIGADGDVVIFDPDLIKDRATYEEPALPPAGIDYVLVGGQVAVEKGRLVNDSLGRALRRPDSAQGRR